MKRLFGFLKQSNVWMIALFLVATLMGITDVSMAETVDGVAGVGKHQTGGDPLNTEIIKTDSPDLILPDIDDRVTVISPYKYPIDTLARTVGRKMKSTGWEYKHYSVDTSAIEDTIAANMAEGTTNESVLQVTNVALFNATDTITVKGVKGYLEDGTTQSTADLMLYVNGKVTDNSVKKLSVTPVNGKKSGNYFVCPALTSGTKIYLLGNAGEEGKIRSYNNNSLPTPQSNYVQKYDIEVGQTSISQMAKQEVNWSLDDQIEHATRKFRHAIERTALLGCKGKTVVPDKNVPIYTTEGIYWQLGRSFELPSSPTNTDLIEMSKTIFKGQSGSNKKILLMGSDFNAAISKIPGIQKQLEAKNTEVIWGIEWNMITTNFGILAALPYDELDMLGKSNEAIVIDPDFIDKWTLIPLGSKNLDTKSNGEFDGDINVTTEISSICLRYKDAHTLLKVVESVPVTGITTSDAAEAVAVGATWDFKSKLTVEPSTATNKSIVYRTSDAAKATISAAGIVTGVGAGVAVVSATTVDGNFTAVATVTVS